MAGASAPALRHSRLHHILVSMGVAFAIASVPLALLNLAYFTDCNEVATANVTAVERLDMTRCRVGLDVPGRFATELVVPCRDLARSAPRRLELFFNHARPSRCTAAVVEGDPGGAWRTQRRFLCASVLALIAAAACAALAATNAAAARAWHGLELASIDDPGLPFAPARAAPAVAVP